MTNDDTVPLMRNALPGMILSLTENQVLIVIRALDLIRQGIPEQQAFDMACADICRLAAS